MDAAEFSRVFAHKFVQTIVVQAIHQHCREQVEAHREALESGHLNQQEIRILGMAAAMTVIVNVHPNDPREIWTDQELNGFVAEAGEYAVELGAA